MEGDGAKLMDLDGAKLDFDEEMNILEELFPDADPNFLLNNCEKYVKLNDPEQLRCFVIETMESRDYPTKSEYLK